MALDSWDSCAFEGFCTPLVVRELRLHSNIVLAGVCAPLGLLDLQTFLNFAPLFRRLGASESLEFDDACVSCMVCLCVCVCVSPCFMCF